MYTPEKVSVQHGMIQVYAPSSLWSGTSDTKRKHPRHCTEVPMHLGANMRKSWQDTSPNMVGRCYFITLALTTQKTFGAIVADVELIVTDDDTMHIEGTARCAADTDPAQAIQHVGASIQIVGASIVLQIRQGQRLSDRDDMVWHTSRAFPVAE